jgi:hypothetical protein
MTPMQVGLIVAGLLGVAVLLFIALMLGFGLASALGESDVPFLGAIVLGLLGIGGALAVLFAIVGFVRWSWMTWATLLA